MGEVVVVGVLSLKLDSTRGCFCQVNNGGRVKFPGRVFGGGGSCRG